MNRDRKTLAQAAIVLCVGAAALAFGSAANGAASAPSAKAVVVKMKEKHGSGISGTATLTAAGKGVRVVLRLRGPKLDNLPAHIHTGPCRREPTFANPRIWSSLLGVFKGKSVTVVTTTTLAQLRTRTYSINVHDPNTLGVVACGDISRAR